MNQNVQVVFHGIDHSDAVEQRILDKVAKLERIQGAITNCRVTVETPHHRNRRSRGFYSVSLDLGLPKRRVVVRSATNPKPAHKDVYVAIRDAFDAARRQLGDIYDRRRTH